MDVSAACAGFMYALVTGMQFVATGCSNVALVIGADTNSRVMNPDDKKTYPLFGDGAGAVLITKRQRRARAAGLHAWAPTAPANSCSCGRPAARGRRSIRAPVPGSGLVREDGRPAGVQVGRAAARRFVATGARKRPASRRTTSSCGCSTRPTFAFSTRPPTRSASTATSAKRTSTATATRRPAACRSRSTKRSAPAASAAATCC